MARKLYYKIIDDGINRITDAEWDRILSLQHWYNSEFIWTAGRPALKMFAVFPNTPEGLGDPEDLQRRIEERRRQMRTQGLTENETILRLEAEGLVIAQKGGYFDKCIASGFTRVAANEFNAYLVSEFLLKASLLAAGAVITAYDEGEFIKPKLVKFHGGKVIVPMRDPAKMSVYRAMIADRRVFSTVDPAKYDQFPRFRTTITEFNEMSDDERLSILKDWNWLGFENNFDLNGDDIQGFDLNRKVVEFMLGAEESS